MQQNKRLITISMLSAIAFILTFIKFTFLPPYLTLDFSDVPTLLATFLLGPVAGILVALIKNILNFYSIWEIRLVQLPIFSRC